MALNTAGRNAAAAGAAAAVTHLGIATADPGASGTANASSAARLAAGWTANTANGDTVATNKNFTGGAASGPAQYVTYWGAATGGTYYGSELLTGDLSFNAAGELTLTSVTLDF